MFRKSVSGMMLILLITSMLALASCVQQARAGATIYIRADGSIDPPTAPVTTVDNVTYVLTASIYASIVVERDNIVVDGAGHLLQGTGGGTGISLSERTNVMIKDLNVSNFEIGLSLQNSSDNQISYNTPTQNVRGIVLASYSSRNYIHDNNVVSNSFGIELDYSNSNVIYWNNLTTNRLYGMYVQNSSDNFICQNNFMNNMNQVYTYKSVNEWNDGWPPYGNYWSDYTGIDEWTMGDRGGNDVHRSDGIGDTAYTIDDRDNTITPAVDWYPMMKPFWLMAAPSNSVSPAYFDTSEYMIGKVAVGVILPESNGTIDPNTENWNNTEESFAISAVETALNRLESFNPAAHLSFQMDVHYRLPTGFEPISRSYGDHELWMDDTMHDLGYSSVLDYVNDLRTKLQTDWAIVLFIVHSDNISSQELAGAALGGPWVIVSARWFWNGYTITMGDLEGIIVHEICHTFYATDEYDGCTGYSGYLNVTGIHNDDCIMGLGAIPGFVCNATREQLGWRDSNSNGIPDIIDTFPEVRVNTFDANQTSNGTLTCTGYIAEVPYPNHNPYINAWPKSHFGRKQAYFPIRRTQRNITINKIVNVQYRIDDGPWINATAIDGAFDEAQENFTFTIPSLPDNNHVIEVLGTNSVGNSVDVVTKPYSGAHDVGVASLYASKSIVGQGHSVDVTAKILNYGPEKESSNITFCANSTTVQTQTVELTAQNLTALTIVWNITSVPCGNYTLTACVGPVLGETDTSDNNCTCNIIVHVGVPGDISGPTQGVYDGKCDMRDISYLIIRFNSKPGSTNWNPNADINNDATVNMRDISIAIINFNKHE